MYQNVHISLKTMLKEKNVKLQKYLHIYVNIKQMDDTFLWLLFDICIHLV